jgi:hypothetical protein
MVDTFLFPQGPRGRPAQVQRNRLLLDATIRDFSGGWNRVDNDLNLDTKFSKVLENLHRGIDGSNSVRPGTELFAETSSYLDEIVGCEYFSNFVVAVGINGKVVRVNSAGEVDLIWDDNFASSLSGSPWELLVQMMQSMLTLVRGCQVVLMRLKGLGAFVIS